MNKELEQLKIILEAGGNTETIVIKYMHYLYIDLAMQAGILISLLFLATWGIRSLFKTFKKIEKID